MGVNSIRDIPDDFPLNNRQRHAATCVQKGEAWFSPELGNELATLKYPLYFMDFETVNPAIPRFAGMCPFQHIPFEFSVHLQKEFGAIPEHQQFLANDAGDPRLEFITSLLAALGNGGSIVVYNQQFESERLSELAAWLPEFSGRIRKIQRRLWDLLPVIRNNVYHPKFAGSFSLKSVLPALFPEMSYEGMAVANGREAGLAWESLVHGEVDRAGREHTRRALLDYCGQDTLSMVRLVEEIRSIVK
jgi:hypothetical protein